MGHMRILLADNDPEILETVGQILEEEFEIVAALENGERVVETVADLDPDLLVLDISMPGLNGIEATSRLRESGARAKVIILTVHEDPDFVEAAFSVGAFGYVLKHLLATDLLQAIREVLLGRRFCSPSLCLPPDPQVGPALISGGGRRSL
jgi:DNA-binding NarL/FixJ family response regulator